MANEVTINIEPVERIISVEVVEIARETTIEVSKALKGDTGATGPGVATGGTTGQFLQKNSNTDFDTDWSTPVGAGDMLASVYDPTNKEADAFDMDNMSAGTTNKILTATEKNEIAANTLKAGITPTQTSNITTNNAKTGITPTQSGDITTNNSKTSYTDAVAVSNNTAKNTYPTADATKLSNLKAAIITIQSGVIIDLAEFTIEVNKEIVTISATSITLPTNDSKIFYIGYDLVDYTVHYLRRNYQDGMVWIGSVETDGIGGITNINNITPYITKTKIKAFLDKLNNSTRAVNVALLGDSIMFGHVSGGGTSFEDKLFDLTASSFGYNVPSISSVINTNYSEGGATAHYGAMLTATACKSGTGNYNSTGVNWDAQDQSNVFAIADYDILRDSPIYRGSYDLVIIGFFVNGGSSNFAWLESVVKNIRHKNIDVIVITENFRAANLELYIENLDIIKNICDDYGCGYADTWSFMREQEYKGVNTIDDTVHPNEAGHTSYANSIRTVINDKNERLADNTPRPTRTIKSDDNVNVAKNFPNNAQFDGLPSSHTGTLIASGVPDLLNPAVYFNGKNGAASVIELEVGEVARFSHGYASGYDIVVDGSMVGNFDYTSQSGGTIQGSHEHPTNLGHRSQLMEGKQAGEYSSQTGQLIGNSAVQVICTSGTVKLYGILWHTFNNSTIPFKNVDKIGTWSEEAGIYGQPKTFYTDTDDDYLTFEFTGSSAVVLLNRRSAAGIIDVYLNGELHTSQDDLYTTGTFFRSILLSTAVLDNNYDDVAIRKNVVTIVLTGSNVSAIAPAAANRRLQISMIKEFDRR